MSLRMRNRVALLALGALFLVLAGCGKKKNHLVPNLPPETSITVASVGTDTLHAANHLIRLHWFGSDPDGEVVAFELRMLNTSNPADSNWVRLDCATGDCNDSLFTLYSPTGFTRAKLEVRAIDNEGARDETPAEQSFSFINNAPACHFTSGPLRTDSTYATASVTWLVDDPGGDVSHLSFRVYLDGNAASYDSIYTGTSTASFTVPSSRFVQGGLWKSGPRKLYVQAVDDGGQLGRPDSIQWYVRSPGLVDMPSTSRGRVLLVDNAFHTSQNNARVDTLYSNTLSRNLPAGTFSILRLEYNNAFRTAEDLAQTFRQFDAVVWYRGYDTFAATVLTAYQDSVGAYLDHGGRFYLEGLNMFEGPGLPTGTVQPMMRNDFVLNQLHCVAQRMYFNTGVNDSSVAWGNRNNNDALPPDFRSSAMADSFRLTSALVPGIRTFVPGDSNNVAFWAKPNALQPAIPENMAVIMSVPQPSGGRFVVVPLPIREALLTYASPARILAKLLFHPTQGLMAP